MSLSVLAAPLLVTAAVDVSRVPAPEIQLSVATPPAVEGPPAEATAASQPSPANDDTLPEEAAPGEDEIIVSARWPSPADPVEKLNEVSYDAVQAVDSAVIGPVAHAYKAGVPKPARDGLHNFLNNLDEPIVFLNFLLQLKPGKAVETLGRFAVNTTIGVGGLFDVAKNKPFNLPRRSNGLADTLGYYGVGPGPYLFLPIIGSTTVRDLAARPFDLLILPAIAPKPFADPKVALAKGALNALDEREQNDEKLARIRSASDPYVVQREEYLARRQAEIDVLKGKRKSIYDPPYYDLPELAPEDENAQEITQEPDSSLAAPAIGKEEIVPSPAGSGETLP